jgi:hypothetical protein
MGAISGMIHIKTIFIFTSGTDKHFICNAVCSCDDPVTELIHILHFFKINSIFYKPPEEKNPEESNLKGKGAGNSSTLFPSINRKTLCPQRHKCDEKSEVMHQLTVKLFPQGHDAKQCPPS